MPSLRKHRTTFFVLPPRQIIDRHGRYLPNANATVKEINYHAFEGSEGISGLPYLRPLARNDLIGIRFSSAHVFGDGNPFGTGDHPDFELQARNLVESGMQSVAKSALARSAEKIRQDIEQGFRACHEPTILPTREGFQQISDYRPLPRLKIIREISS